jgi:hypothetical protein
MEARMAKSKQVKREMIRRQFDGLDENSIFIRQLNKIVKNRVNAETLGYKRGGKDEKY